MGMIFVDSWLLYQKCTGSKESQAVFYEKLAEELIDNTHDGIGVRDRAEVAVPPTPNSLSSISVSSMAASITTPNKKKHKVVNEKTGKVYWHTNQQKCQVCKRGKCTHQCRLCFAQRGYAGSGLCSRSTRTECSDTHYQMCHPTWNGHYDDVVMQSP